MRIALVSTPFVPVPPPRYGGTELIVAELSAGLAAAGHDVTLFATGDSRPPPRVRLRARFEQASWPPDPRVERAHAAFCAEQIADDDFDVVHAHVPALLEFAPFTTAPLVYTVHHDGGDDFLRQASLYARAPAQFVTVSARQRLEMPMLMNARVIHHGLDPAHHRLGPGDGGHCAFLGRFARQKAPHVAIDVARAAHVPIELGGKPHWPDEEYFACEMIPRLGQTGVRYRGELGVHAKHELLGRARALLFPIDWEEPFGLVMIEAMLAGTPVLALARGAVPEVVDDGITGFVCRDAHEMTERLRTLDDGFDRQRCRQRAMARFSTARMVRDHLRLYEELCHVRAAQTFA